MDEAAGILGNDRRRLSAIGNASLRSDVATVAMSPRRSRWGVRRTPGCIRPLGRRRLRPECAVEPLLPTLARREATSSLRSKRTGRPMRVSATTP
jgi:hypothetical protein